MGILESAEERASPTINSFLTVDLGSRSGAYWILQLYSSSMMA